MSFQRRSVYVFGVLAIVLGVALLAETAAEGGGGLNVGYALGLLFIGLGVGRIYLLRRR